MQRPVGEGQSERRDQTALRRSDHLGLVSYDEGFEPIIFLVGWEAIGQFKLVIDHDLINILKSSLWLLCGEQTPGREVEA